ncbi:SDR family NAD(P)-dependent oxidoreductase [Gryllotalpicola reticulitermitis]|uniref:SDR family NAD(P)-dependent oxidoreductase n=1 Tax=Gryllotalpicola reticulitermitis TaxID=1184153 RepID=A0ABV8QBE8_9MICO
MPAHDGWDPRRLPEQSGKVFLVTGGSRGIGYFAAEQLAGAGARVVIAARDAQRARRAVDAITHRIDGAEVEVLELDLASLSSVRAAGERIAEWPRLDGVAANGAVTWGPASRATTVDGFEVTFGTNHLGHFALAATAWPALARTSGSRWAAVTSSATTLVPASTDDLNSERRYARFRAYALSKHAVQAFAWELDRRLHAAGSSSIALAAHPGYAADGLTAARAGVTPPHPPTYERLLAGVAQGKNHGAMPLVRALTDPAASGSELFGPEHGMRGPAVLKRPRGVSASPAFGQELWQLSETWTGLTFEP